MTALIVAAIIVLVIAAIVLWACVRASAAADKRFEAIARQQDEKGWFGGDSESKS